MIKNIYQLICFINHDHKFITGWNNQYGFGWCCKCGKSAFTRKVIINGYSFDKTERKG